MFTLKELNENFCHTILLVLHDINQAIRYCHQIHILKNGRLIESLDTHFPFEMGSISESFHVDIRSKYDEKNQCAYGLMDRKKGERISQ